MSTVGVDGVILEIPAGTLNSITVIGGGVGGGGRGDERKWGGGMFGISILRLETHCHTHTGCCSH